MPNINPIDTYNSDAYLDIDRAAATALRLPLIAQLATLPPEDRAPWLINLAHGITDGLGQGADIDPAGDAYRLGQRIALLLVEEGNA